MWAGNDTAYLYVSDTVCDVLTATPCKPSTNPALKAITCTNTRTCQRKTSQTSAISLCLILANTDTLSPLGVDLSLTGARSTTTDSSSGDGGGGLSTLDIVLISVGAAAGLIILGGLVSLTVWLLCCRAPPGSRVSPMAAPGDAGGFAAKSMSAPATMPPGPGPNVMTGTMTILPPPSVYPYPSYGDASNGGAQYSGAQYGGAHYGGAQYVSPQPPRSFVSARSLTPLPVDAYRAVGPNGSETPVLLAPPLPPPTPQAMPQLPQQPQEQLPQQPQEQQPQPQQLQH